MITKIGLSKLFLWMEAERIESYPEVFSKLEAEKIYTKKTLAANVIGLSPKGSGKFVRGDFLDNLFGLERSSEQKILIRGINALRTIAAEKYTPSTNAIEIGKSYKLNNKNFWVIEFAKMIARYEVRTRMLLYLLGKGGCVLSFPNEEFFGSLSSRAILSGLANEITLFTDNSAKFNELLQEYRWVALGPWWESEITNLGLQLDQGFRFEGIRETNPSTNTLNTRIKVSLFLMKYLGILEDHAGGWIINPIRATSVLGDVIAQDFVNVMYDRSPIQHLHEWQAELQDSLGFIVVADLVQQWKEYKGLTTTQAEIEFDDWMRRQIYQGRVRILEMHAGQSRLGRGLYGDDAARKIRFEVFEA